MPAGRPAIGFRREIREPEHLHSALGLRTCGSQLPADVGVGSSEASVFTRASPASSNATVGLKMSRGDERPQGTTLRRSLSVDKVGQSQRSPRPVAKSREACGARRGQAEATAMED
jgi:hypothetical protein